MYKIKDGIVVNGNLEVGSCEFVLQLVESVIKKESNLNVKAVKNNKAVVLTEGRKLATVDYIELQDLIKVKPIDEIKDTTYNLPKTGLLEELLNKIDNLHDTDFFSEHSAIDTFYYIMLADRNNLNLKAVNEMFKKMPANKAKLIIELVMLIQNNVITKEIANSILSKSKIAEGVYNICKELGVKFKAKTIALTDTVNVGGFTSSLKYPIIGGANLFENTLKKSTPNPEIETTVDLTVPCLYLRFKNAIEKSKSVKLHSEYYNAVVEKLVEYCKDDRLLITEFGAKRFSNEYKGKLENLCNELFKLVKCYVDDCEINKEDYDKVLDTVLEII